MKNLYSALMYTTALTLAVPLVSTAQLIADNNSTTSRRTLKENNSSATAADNGGKPVVKQWEKAEDQVNGRINKSDLVKMKNRSNAMIGFLKDSCFASSSFSPVWHGEYYSSKGSTSPVMKYGIQCAMDKAHLTIMANDITPLLEQTIINNKEYFFLMPQNGTKNNCPYFEAAPSANEAQTHAGFWLVASPDQQPYIILTRKDYLQEAIGELHHVKEQIIAEVSAKTPVRSKAAQEAEKKAAIDELSSRYSGADLQYRIRVFEQNYKTDEDYFKEGSDKATADVDTTTHVMEGLLKNMPAQELAKPAIVSVPAAQFAGFEDGLAGNRILVKMNPACFRPDLAPDAPQFFLIQWSIAADDAAAADIDKLFRERLDVSNLKAMIGK